ncbi:hypothetical protein GCM10009595_01300 [Falsarthrobacter nasiphocae]
MPAASGVTGERVPGRGLLGASRRKRGDAGALVPLVAVLAAHVDSGQGVFAAMRHVAARCQGSEAGGDKAVVRGFGLSLRQADLAQRVGADPARVLVEAAGGSEDPILAGALRDLAACLELSSARGVPLGSLLAHLADSLQARLDAEAALEAVLAGPAATARLLVALPAVGAGLSVVLLGGQWVDAAASPVGRVLLLAGTALMVASRVWTGRILKRARLVEVRA